MSERDIAAEIAEGVKEVEKINKCQHRWELIEQPRYNEYVYKCPRCGAVQFGLVEGQV